jgi:hypothetical protein
VGRKLQRSRIASCRPRVAVAVVILAFLIFTTVRTSPITTGVGPGSSLTSTTPKQRNFAISQFSLAGLVLVRTLVPPPSYSALAVPAEFKALPRECFFPRCSDLPPPVF